MENINSILQKKLNANFTIEAAVIVPITMVIIITIFFAAFYMRDTVTVKSESEVAILDEAGHIEEKPNTGYLQSSVEGKVLMAKNVSASVKGEDDEYSAYVHAGFDLPIPMIESMLGRDMENINTEINISNLDARKQLLKYKAIADGAESPDVDQD